MRAFLALPLAIVAIGLVGCESRPTTYYLFGAANSCFPTSKPVACNKPKAYDALELAVFPQKQEVSYVRRGLGLDQDNVIFKKLEGCVVVDKGNFSCAGLKMVDGEFADTSEYPNVTITRSFITYAFSYYVGATVSRSRLEFLDKHNSWIQPVLIVFAGIAILVLLSGA